VKLQPIIYTAGLDITLCRPRLGEGGMALH